MRFSSSLREICPILWKFVLVGGYVDATNVSLPRQPSLYKTVVQFDFNYHFIPICILFSRTRITPGFPILMPEDTLRLGSLRFAR